MTYSSSDVFYEIRTNNNETGYTNRSFTMNNIEILYILYYDYCSFLDILHRNEEGKDLSFVSETGFNGSAFSRIDGFPTGGKLRILDGEGTWLNNVIYYDEEGQLLQSVAENHLGNIERATYAYDF